MSTKSAWTGARPHIDKSELLCKTGCGYYGNPAWNGHCSKCYKELIGKKQRKPVFDPTQIKNKVSQSVSDVTEFQSKASSLVSRKLDRIDAKFDKRTKAVKSIFKKPSIKVIQDQGRTHHHLSEDSQVKDNLEDQIKSLNSDLQVNIKRYIRNFEDKLQKLTCNQSLDDLSEQFQDFYNGLKDIASTTSLREELCQDEVDKTVYLSERYITTRYYRILSNIVNPFSEERDLAIQKRIRSLIWVTCSHLECNIDENDDEIKNILDQIIADLLEIDSKWIPSEKLSLLVSASHRILNLLKKTSGVAGSADDLLPALIYCVIRANPPLLHSNICYITTFAQQSSIQSGETGYFFTNLCCAVSFIEKLTAGSLGLTDAEFDHYMSGDALSPNALDGTYCCEAIQMMKQSLQSLEEYESCLSRILASYDDLTAQLDQSKEDITNGIDLLMESYPLTVKSKHTNIDEPDPVQEMLPPPLQPESMHLDGTAAQEVKCISPARSAELFNEELFVSTTLNSYFNKESTGSHCDSDSIPWDPFSSPSTGRSNTSKDAASLSQSSPGAILMPQVLQPIYTGFTIQGERIPNIPCDTGVAHSLYSNPHPLSPLQDENQDSLPPPLSPTIAGKQSPVNDVLDRSV